jgi:hypothetical protein
MDDRHILAHINAPIEEEHRLTEHTRRSGANTEEQARLEKLEVHLDQRWDLPRQRRARHPGQAGV